VAAYYNEIDSFAAAWLRELIKAGLIADGEVDERSIADVRPDDLRGFTQCHFFAGIGGWSVPCVSPDGTMIIASGQVAAPVSRSRVRGAAMAPMIRATFGLRGSGSSRSAALQSSLANRLRARMDGRGSMLFALTWKRVATPSGRLIYRLAASGRRMGGSGFGSWPSPIVTNAKGTAYTYARGNHDTPSLTLVGMAQLAHWTTPSACEQSERPEVKDARNAAHRAAGKMKGVGSYKLSTQVLTLSTWRTPNATDSKERTTTIAAVQRRMDKGQQVGIEMQAKLVDSGPMRNGSLVVTGGRAQLNPAHSRWLMGYPPAWDACAVTAMQSFRPLRRSSSKRT
jgi:hypothetical protein